MEKDFLIQLTNNLYRLTLFFPKKEPLRYKMREVASDILANSLLISNPSKKIEIGSLQSLNDLEILDSFFEVAKTQHWVSPSDILAVQTEYISLMKELEGAKAEKKERNFSAEIGLQPLVEMNAQSLLPRSNSGRQEKILNFLKENGKTQIWQVKQVFPEVTKRTLRRDFEQMLKQRLIERVGEKNNTFYQLKVDVA